MEPIIYSPAVASDEVEIKSLLSICQLPGEDIAPHLMNFMVAKSSGKVIGVIGLEVYGEVGLLRSLAVSPQFRHLGVAAALHAHIFTRAFMLQLKELYLLTDTAVDYAARLGFQVAERKTVPESIRNTAEFHTLCPGSTTCMVLAIR